MTSSDFIYKFGFRARIKKLETAIRKQSSSKKHPVDKTKSIHYFYGCVPTCKKASSCFQKKIFQKKIFQKKKREKWEAKVLEFWSKQPLQQQSTLACFIEPVCMVDLWNDCFLPVQSSLYFSAWLWTTALEMYVEFFWIFVCG